MAGRGEPLEVANGVVEWVVDVVALGTTPVAFLDVLPGFAHSSRSCLDFQTEGAPIFWKGGASF